MSGGVHFHRQQMEEVQSRCTSELYREKEQMRDTEEQLRRQVEEAERRSGAEGDRLRLELEEEHQQVCQC